MDVSRWMTKSVLTIKPHDTLRHARERLAKYRINQLPVVVNDKLVGIVTDRDIRDAYPSSLRLLHGKDIDGRPITVNEARPKEEGGGGGGRRGGGGGYGGGGRRGGGGGGYGGGGYGEGGGRRY